MDCTAFRERLAPFLDGELDRDEERAACAHLERCEDCAALVERVGAVPLPRPEPRGESDAAFWVAMDRALEAEARRPVPFARRVRNWLGSDVRLSRGVVVLYVALLGAAFLWNLLEPEPPAAAIAQPATAQPAAGDPAPPAAPPPASAAPQQRLERASYAPVQQMY